MADKSADGYTEALADNYLNTTETDWSMVPWLEENWPEMSHNERLDYDLEWNITEDRLYRLIKWAEAGRLNPEQMERYRKLMELVEKYRPTIERLREG